MTAKEIAKLVGIIRSSGQVSTVGVEYRKGGRWGKLTEVTLATGEKGRPTRQIIRCLDNGTEAFYDKKCEFDVVALTVDGRRVEIPQRRGTAEQHPSMRLARPGDCR